MKNIKIKNWLNGDVIIVGKYESIKNCLENNNGADLRGADLCGADLCEADLRGANLHRADLDFSVLDFSCKSLKVNTDERQRIQLAFHWASWVINSNNTTKEEKTYVKNMLKYINQFHREDVDRIEID